MTKLPITYALVLSAIFLSACGGNKQQDTTQTESEAPVEAEAAACSYAYAEQPVEVLWVAYKYSEKTGVKGTFESVQVTAEGSGESPAAVLEGAQFTIETASSNSGDATRDPKIKESFFGMLEEGEIIKGSITSAEGDGQTGTLMADISMNGQTQAASGSYEVTGESVEMKFELNVDTWGAMDALNALNEVCEDLHKGSDGKSVLWPDVTVFVTTQLQKTCD